MRECGCGCGAIVYGRKRFVSKEHYPLPVSVYQGEWKATIDCECGCGESVKPYNNGRYRKYATRKCAQREHSRIEHLKLKTKLPNDEAPLCACGCGEIITIYYGGKWSKYIHGHTSRTPEARARMSERSKRMWRDGVIGENLKSGVQRAWREHGEEWSRKISEGHKKRPDARQKHECKCGCGELTAHRVFVDKEHQEKYWLDQRGDPPLCACGCGQVVRRRKCKWNTYIKGHPTNHDYTKTPEYRANMSRIMNTPEKLKELSEKSKQNYFKEEYLEKWSKGVNLRPNNFEFLFDCLTSKDIKYVGNAKLWIKLPNGKPKNPDFVFGKNKVIELHGDYWHQGEDETQLIQAYNEVGYECLVIWEKDMQNISSVLQKVSEFIGQATWQLSLPLR